MRKILFTFLSLVLAVCGLQAQPMMGYELELSTPGYSAITGGTVVPTSELGSDFNYAVIDGTGTSHTSSFEAQGYPIGFDFRYNDQLLNQFVVGARGYLVLGKDNVSASATNGYFIFSEGPDDNVVGMWYRSDVVTTETTEISYKLEGTEGDRVLVVQWNDLQLQVENWNGTVVKGVVQFQVRLYEATGNVEFCFNNFKPLAGVSMNYNDQIKMGLRGTGTDFIMKYGTFADNVVALNDQSVGWTASNYPADGTHYLWKAPEDCVAPAAQPTNLMLSSTSVQVSGEFTASESADHYLVLISKNATLSALPEDGVMYSEGEAIGDATVVTYTAETSFYTPANLEGATPYYIFVVATNSVCMYGPKYNTADVLTATIGTRPEAPVAIQITNADLSELTVSVESNTAGNDVILAWTDVPLTNVWGDQIPGGTFGEPTGDLNVGDDITGGGKVFYKGAAGSDIKLEGLEEAKLYHVKAWSVDASGSVSSTAVSADALTAGNVPWTDGLLSQPPYEAPSGWRQGSDNIADYGYWSCANNVDDTERMLECRDINGDPTTGTQTWIETPDIYLDATMNRVVFSMNMNQYVNWSTSAYPFTSDVLEIQVTTDGENYQTVATFDKDNYQKQSTAKEVKKYYVSFAEAAGQKARIRFLFRLYGNPVITLSNIRVERKGECDYPVNVMAVEDLVVGDQAGIDWTCQGEEDAWEVRYRLAPTPMLDENYEVYYVEHEWCEPIVTREHPFIITGLEGLTDYEVQVRARCSATEKSDWSETLTFKSGLAVPFNIVFGDLDAAPSGWQTKVGELGSDLTDSEDNGWSWYSGWWSSYMRYMSYTPANNNWFISPMVDLGDGSYNLDLNMKLMVTGVPDGTDDKMLVVVSRDGLTFSADDVILTINHDDFPADYEEKEYTASLKGYTGPVRVGLLMTSVEGGTPMFQFQEFGIQFTCVNDAANFEVVETTETTAKVKWESGADKWFVFHREEGTTEQPAYTELTTPEYEMTDLKPHTTYEVGITKACEEGDTAKVMFFDVTTAGELCPEVENVVVTPKKYSARIEWESEAGAYNVKYRQSGSEEWIIETVTETHIDIRDLLSATDYEYAIQARCSKVDNDTSEYTPVSVFTTLEETVFPPTDIVVVPTYKDATVTWQGETDGYDINYRKVGDTNWKMAIVAGQKEVVLKRLEASTDYQLRMRSVNIAEKDTSLWSATVDFRTLDIPECVTPTDLMVTDLGATSAQLSWTADESNLTWNLRYRDNNASEWQEVLDLAETTYLLDGLTPNTVYLWRVQATCEEERTSNWASQNRFTTAVPTGIDAVSVFGNGLLNIINPEGGLIKSIAVYSLGGQMLAFYDVNSTENVFVRMDGLHGDVVVKVVGEKQTKAVKMHLK